MLRKSRVSASFLAGSEATPYFRVSSNFFPVVGIFQVVHWRVSKGITLKVRLKIR